MKLLFLGDTHGNTSWVDNVIATAANHDIDWIVQLGDFGYWEHKRSGVEYLFCVQAALEEHDQHMVFIDGNHENHPVLRRNYGPEAEKHRVHPDYGFWRVRDRLWHAPRAHRWKFDAVQFMSMGGAYSIDKNTRKVGTSWWWEELTTDEEIDQGIAGGLVDVLLTHDCPAGVQGAIWEQGGLDRQKDRWPESLQNRERLKRLVTQVRPYALVHGHYHHRNTEMYRFAYGDDEGHVVQWETLIEGLACDEMNGAALIWTTEELQRHG